MANKYYSRRGTFFVFLTVAAVVISVSTLFQDAEGALLAKDGGASELARAKRMDKDKDKKYGPPTMDVHFVGGAVAYSKKEPKKDDSKDDSSKTDDSKKQKDDSGSSKSKRK
jgi:hypothetical protein